MGSLKSATDIIDPSTTISEDDSRVRFDCQTMRTHIPHRGEPDFHTDKWFMCAAPVFVKRPACAWRGNFTTEAFGSR